LKQYRKDGSKFGKQTLIAMFCAKRQRVLVLYESRTRGTLTKGKCKLKAGGNAAEMTISITWPAFSSIGSRRVLYHYGLAPLGVPAPAGSISSP
jgi:hypothetical protein